MTKEAKLTAAQRIVPEWKDYDNEIKNLMARVDDEQHQYEGTAKNNNNEGEHEENLNEKLSNFYFLFFAAEKASTTQNSKTEL